MKYVVEIKKMHYFLDGKSKRFFIEADEETPSEWNNLTAKQLSQKLEGDLIVLAKELQVPFIMKLKIDFFLKSVQKGLTKVPSSYIIKTYSILNDSLDKNCKFMN